MPKSTQPQSRSRGSIVVSILIITIFLTTVVSAIAVLANANIFRARSRVYFLEAQYAAESGADGAIAMLNSGNDTYSGTGSEVTVLSNNSYKATYVSSVINGSTSKERVITATGKVYTPKTAATATYNYKIEVVAQRSSTQFSSSLTSRNIIYIESGVKNITAKDIYANGFIQLNKNTTNLIGENITVADKNTGASNCSIGGSGNLLKPSSFTTAGQTKTNITVAYNNCIAPPGNSNNGNFNVLVNQVNISKVASTYIPWSQFMDSSYLSAGSCNDWTTGSSPHNIPSVTGSKITHYPDNGNGISTSCGTSGNIDLGNAQYNIRDNVHIRANLCSTTACTPTFYNPDSGAAGIKFVFIEGNINFDSLQTAAGSGPIVFVVYGTDPASKVSVCPYGGAIYLGKSGTTSAPAAYLLAMNGLCADKTKFGSALALGGLSGKNIYIATNPGTPFDLGLDPNFPANSIPLDLAWRAVRYRRL